MSNISEDEKKSIEAANSDSTHEANLKDSQKEMLGKNSQEKNKKPSDKTIGHDHMKEMSEEEMSEIGRKKAAELKDALEKKKER